MVALEQPRLKKLSEIGERTDYFFRPPRYEKELLRWKDMSDAQIQEALERAEKIIFSFQFSAFKKGELQKIFFETMEGEDRGWFLWPLRVALTGKKASPGPFEIMEILGKESSLERISAAKRKLGIES